MNPRYNNFNNMPKNDRFVFPFLTGALVGGASLQEDSYKAMIAALD